MNTEIWAAIHTPFTADGKIDLNGVQGNVEKYIALGIDGIFCNGFMGEGWYLSVDEKKLIAKTLVDTANGRLKVCAVATQPSEKDTVDLGLFAKNHGVDYTALITPSTLTPKEELISHFTSLFKKIDMPFVVFNAFTLEGSVLTPEVFTVLCECENVKILKTSASDEVNNAFRKVARQDVRVSDPSEEKFFTNMTEQGQDILFADPEPYLYQKQNFRPIEQYAHLVEVGKIAEAQAIFASLNPLRILYNKWIIGPFHKGIKINAYLKKWSEVVGLAGGYVRYPLLPLTAKEEKQMEQEIHAAMETVLMGQK